MITVLFSLPPFSLLLEINQFHSAEDKFQDKKKKMVKECLLFGLRMLNTLNQIKKAQQIEIITVEVSK